MFATGKKIARTGILNKKRTLLFASKNSAIFFKYAVVKLFGQFVYKSFLTKFDEHGSPFIEKPPRGSVFIKKWFSRLNAFLQTNTSRRLCSFLELFIV